MYINQSFMLLALERFERANSGKAPQAGRSPGQGDPGRGPSGNDPLDVFEGVSGGPADPKALLECLGLLGDPEGRDDLAILGLVRPAPRAQKTRPR